MAIEERFGKLEDFLTEDEIALVTLIVKSTEALINDYSTRNERIF